EQVTIGLLALALQTVGVKSRSWLSWQIPIRTDAAYAKARIVDINTAEMDGTMAAGEVPIAPGFRRLSPEQRKNALGRAGWHTRRSSRPIAATSTPTSTASTPPIRGSWRRRARSTR